MVARVAHVFLLLLLWGQIPWWGPAGLKVWLVPPVSTMSSKKQSQGVGKNTEQKIIEHKLFFLERESASSGRGVEREGSRISSSVQSPTRGSFFQDCDLSRYQESDA